MQRGPGRSPAEEVGDVVHTSPHTIEILPVEEAGEVVVRLDGQTVGEGLRGIAHLLQVQGESIGPANC